MRKQEMTEFEIGIDGGVDLELDILNVDLPEIPNCEDIKKSHPQIYQMFQEIYAHQLGLITLPDAHLDENG